MLDPTLDRRRSLKLALLGPVGAAAASVSLASLAAKEGKKEEKEVEANEDLMREHGVLRRALLVYRAAATRLRSDSAGLWAASLNKTARLFRAFGENYHERQPEEPFIFPVVRKLLSPVAAYPDVLKAQHDRGRELTDYVMHARTRSSSRGGRKRSRRRLTRRCRNASKTSRRRPSNTTASTTQCSRSA